MRSMGASKSSSRMGRSPSRGSPGGAWTPTTSRGLGSSSSSLPMEAPCEPRLTLVGRGRQPERDLREQPFRKTRSQGDQAQRLGTILDVRIRTQRAGHSRRSIRARCRAVRSRARWLSIVGGNTTSLDFSGERIRTEGGSRAEEECDGKATKNPNAKPAEGKSTEQATAKRRVIVMLKSRQRNPGRLFVDRTRGRIGGPCFPFVPRRERRSPTRSRSSS